MAVIPFALNPELTKYREKSDEKNPVARSLENQAVDELKNADFAKNGLQIGDTMPDFELPNALEKLVSSRNLNQGGLVINFYRGSWCPYCNMELNALRKILPQIRAHGADLVAISPETPDNSLSWVQKNKLEIEVLSDTENQLAKQIGIAFEIPNYLAKVYQGFGLNIDKLNGSGKFELPLPATYVLNKNGEVKFAFADEDFTIRAEPREILATLEQFV